MNNFLNATQCDLLIAKLDASDRIASVAYEKNRRGVDAETARTSTHVRVAKAETVVSISAWLSSRGDLWRTWSR